MNEDGSFKNWLEGEPSGVLDSEDCMYMYSPYEYPYSDDGEWGDYPCDYTGPAVCSKPIASSAAAARNTSRA